MTSTQSLLYAAESGVTLERVRALVAQVGPEAPTVEYKEKMAPTIARGIAALGNTYGGLMLVGVTDGRKVVGVKEKTIEAIAEHCAAKIEPPWVPEIIPVPMDDGSGLYVLVLRVVPGHHPRPMLVDGVAPVRHQNTTHPADWQRLKDLFTETAAIERDQPWNVQRPDIPSGPEWNRDSGVDFVLRTGLNVAVAGQAKWRPLPEQSMARLIDALNQSPLASALLKLSLISTTAGCQTIPFHHRGHNRSRTVRLEWHGLPDGWEPGMPIPVAANVRIEVPGGYGYTGTHLQVELDVIIQFSAWIKAVRAQRNGDPGAAPDQGRHSWQVSVQELKDLFDALVATVSGQAVTELLADLAAIAQEAVPQLRVVHLVTERPITEVLDTTGLKPIQDAGTSHGTHVLADPALDLADSQDRQEQVKTWLGQLALDAGLLGMEPLLR